MRVVPEHLLRLPRNTLLRSHADDEYADGDDATWLGVDWPALTRQVLVDGRRVNVVDTGGDGPPLLFLHGLGGVWQNWLLNIPAFMGAQRVIAPDLPGFGRSEMPDGRISIQGYARVIDALCRELGVDDPVVVGNSMGGFVGCELALAFPTRVRRLALVSPAGLTADELRRQPLVMIARAWAATSRPGGVPAAPLLRRPRLRRALLQGVARHPERLSIPIVHELAAGSGTPGFVGGLDAVLSYRIRERLPQIEVPTLIVWGRNDVVIPVADAARFERLIGANARAVIFENTGHIAMLERPGRFNALLADFITGSGEPEAGVEGVVSA